MQEKKKKLIENFFIIVVILLTIILLGKVIFAYNITKTHDGYIHILKIAGVSDIISKGQLPPIINPNFCNGYAINLFYNPLTTYIAVFFSNIFNNYIIGTKALMYLMLVLSAIFMFYFAKEVTKKKEIAFVSSIFYISVPYFLSNIYVRGAIGECAALTFLPLLFLGIYNLFDGDRKKHFFIAIGAIGLLLSHNITTLYSAIFCFIYMIINIKKLKEKDVIIKLITNIFFIILITLFFIFPLGLHKIIGDYVVFDHELLRTYGERVAEETIDVKQLFFVIDKEEPVLVFNIFQFLLFIPFAYIQKFVDKKYRKFYIAFGILSILLTICILFSFLWLKAPNLLCMIQFPWRLLGFVRIFYELCICNKSCNYY